MTTTRTRIWLAAGGLFLFGLTVGVCLTVMVGGRQLRRGAERPDSRTLLVERVVERIGRDLAHELALTPDEVALVRRELITAALATRQARLHALAESSREFRAATQRIAAGLAPEKRESFDRITRERLRRVGLGSAPGPWLRRTEGNNAERR